MYIFIVNPNSRSGRGLQIWNDLKSIIEEKKIKYQVYFTNYQKHATKIIAGFATDNEEHTFVVLGGDGTINEVCNGIHNFHKVTLGYIPTGSSNDFARAHKLPTNPREALEKILTSKRTKLLDMGLLTYQRHSRRFMVSAGIGFDASVCHYAAVSKWKNLMNKLKLGKLTYVGIALGRLLFNTPASMKITIDDNEPMHFDKTYFVAIMNHCYEGGGFKFCPKALPDDGALDVIVAHNISKLRIITILPLAFKGLHTRCRGIHTYTCKNVIIESEHTLPIHTDGEPIFLQKKIAASLAPNQVRVIV